MSLRSLFSTVNFTLPCTRIVTRYRHVKWVPVPRRILDFRMEETASRYGE